MIVFIRPKRTTKETLGKAERLWIVGTRVSRGAVFSGFRV